MARGTETASSDPQRDAWALSAALDGRHLDATPARRSLADVDEVEIGRGETRAFHRRGHRLRVDLADRRCSEVHLRLVRSAEAWALEDAGSKNGTLVNGRPATRRLLADGDVVQCGGTFFVLRRAAGPIGDLDAPAGAAGLATLSPTVERELQSIPRIARSGVPVLIEGDSGTGKELAARALHDLSGRSGPLVAVDCDVTVDAQAFRRAARGTLFLDEVADLPASSQAALLRFLHDDEVRIVAATSHSLERLVEAGRFRHDVCARLRGCRLRLPPLRARMEDLGLLVAALVARIEPGGPAPRLSVPAASALFQASWPLNVRELEQTLRAALAVAADRKIELGDLPPALRSAFAGADLDVGVEAERLAALMHKLGGNVSAMARELRTSRSQVRRLLARHALTPRR